MQYRRLNGCIIKMYNCIMRTRFINKNNKICRRLRGILLHNFYGETQVSFGSKNPDRLFYVIRSPHDRQGFFAVYNSVVNHLRHAEELHAEPIVDWQYYPNPAFTEDDTAGRINAWELFFEPMLPDVTLSEVYQSKNVIMSGGGEDINPGHLESKQYMDESQRLIGTYIHLKREIRDYINDFMTSSGMKDKRVVGVVARGTDYVETKPHWHGISATADQNIEGIEEQEKAWGKFDKIFLATEDETIRRKLQEHFGDRLVYNQTIFVKTSNGQLLNVLYDTGELRQTKLRKTMEYIAAVYILTECDALIASSCTSAHVARRIRGDYELCYMFRLGSYD